MSLPSFTPEGYIQPPTESNKPELWSMITGIGALVLSWLPFFPILFGAGAITLGFIGKGISERNRLSRTKSLVGIGLGATAILVNIVIMILIYTLPDNA